MLQRTRMDILRLIWRLEVVGMKQLERRLVGKSKQGVSASHLARCLHQLTTEGMIRRERTLRRLGSVYMLSLEGAAWLQENLSDKEQATVVAPPEDVDILHRLNVSESISLLDVATRKRDQVLKFGWLRGLLPEVVQPGNVGRLTKGDQSQMIFWEVLDESTAGLFPDRLEEYTAFLGKEKLWRQISPDHFLPIFIVSKVALSSVVSQLQAYAPAQDLTIYVSTFKDIEAGVLGEVFFPVTDSGLGFPVSLASILP